MNLNFAGVSFVKAVPAFLGANTKGAVVLSKSEKEEVLFLKEKRYPDNVLDFSQYRGKTVLDIGCGSGTLVSILNKHGANAFGVDPLFDHGLEGQLFKKYPSFKKSMTASPNMLLAGDGTQLPIRENSVDAIFSNHAIFSFRTPLNVEKPTSSLIKKLVDKDKKDLDRCIPAVQEIERILKPGGKFYATPVNLVMMQQLLIDAKTHRLAINNDGYIGDTFAGKLKTPDGHPPIVRDHWVEITKR